MDKQSTDHKEETLVAMLASFRKEACYHDTFEEDFLRNFHLRKETDQAAHSAWKLLLERLNEPQPKLLPRKNLNSPRETLHMKHRPKTIS